MSFVTELNRWPRQGLLDRARQATTAEVRQSLQTGQRRLNDFAHLISPAAEELLERLCQEARRTTQQRFGKVIRLFAPLYLSNECINNCKYCGFSRDNPILRVTLSIPEVVAEAASLQAQGFRHLLLVAGEHPRFVSPDYLRQCVLALRDSVPSIALEVGPMETAQYQPLARAGADGLVAYQETYDREVYEQMHTAGPKRDFDWRLATPERAYAAGFRRLGIGALYGLSDWRAEALALASHAAYLLRHCWKAQLTVSLPRLRPCAGEFQPPTPLPDRSLAQLICAFRLTFPDIGLVLSTREPALLRDGLIPLGVTLMSAGSHTEPGGYTGAGLARVHLTQRGRVIPPSPTASEWSSPTDSTHTSATGQFSIADDRTPHEVAERIRHLGYEPVWKDWDTHLTAPATRPSPIDHE